MEAEIKLKLEIGDEALMKIQDQVNIQAVKVLKDKNFIDELVKKHVHEIIEMQLVSFLEEFDVYEYSDHMMKTKNSLYDMVKPYMESWMKEKGSEFKESMMIKIQEGMESTIQEVLDR